jgi:elongation factor Ts
MAEITAAMVKELREKTDAPMMECKKALTEAAGDLVQAEEILRVKLGNRASKAASRVAAEGVIAARIAGAVGAMVEVNCETDFVTKNEGFLALASRAVDLIIEKNPKDVAALMALDVDGQPLEEARRALVGKIGENMTIRRFVRYDTKGKLATYLHGTKIGVLVDYTGGDEQVGKDIAMHVAAHKPICVSRDQVPAERIETERKIFTAQAAESGKPAEIVAKMVDGKINKYLAEVALLGQPFVKNPDETVEKMLKGKGAAVTAFTLYVVGEGIDRGPDDDFAAEVARLSKGG